MPEAFEELIAEIGADLSKLDKGLKEASTKIDRFKQGAGKGPSVSSPFDKLGESLGKVGMVAQNVGRTMTRFITLPLIGMAAAAVKSFSDFDSAMTQSTAIMGQKGVELRKELEGVARDVARTTSFSAKEAADSYFFLASAGLDAAASMQALPKVANFAQAGMFDMARATDILTDAQSALGLTIRDDAVANMENLVRVSDTLVKANVLANASVEQFGDALTNRAGAAARILGKDVEETVAILAAFADQGTKGEKAGEALSIVWRDLQRAALENVGAFRKFNVTVFDSAGEMLNTADIVKSLETALGGMSDAQRKTTLSTLGFQERSISNLLTLIGTSDAIRRYEAELRNAAGTTDEIAKKQLQSFKEQMGLAKDRILDAAIALGEKLAPTILSVATKISDFVDGLVKLNPAILEMGARAAAVAASGGPLALMAGKLLALGPKGLVVAAVVAGAAAMAVAYSTNFGAMQDTLDDFAKHLSRTFGLAKKDVGDFGTLMAQMASGLATEFDFILTFLNQFLNALKTVVETTIALNSLQWEKIPEIIARGVSQADEIEQGFLKREEKRMQERYILQTEGYQGLMDRLRIISEKGAEGIRTTFDKGFEGHDPLKEFRSNILKTEDQIIQDTLTFGRKFQTTVENILIDVDKQKLYREAQEIGFAIGSGVTQGNREGLEKKSPTRVERDILEMSENVIKILADGAIKGGKAAQKYAEEIKKAFSEMASGVAAAVGGSLQITTEIWAKLSQDDRKVLGQIRREHEQFEKDMTLLALKEAVERRKNQKDIYDLIADDIQKQFARIGGTVLGFTNTFKSMVKTIKAEAVDLSASMFALSDNVTRAFDKNTQSLARNLASLSEIISGGKLGTVQFAEVELAYRKMAEGINQATQLHIAGDSSAGILKLRDTVKELVDFWNQKGQEWGLSTATISKQIRADLDNLIAGLPEEYQKAMREVADAMIGNLEHIEQQSKPKLKSIAEQYEELEHSVGQGMAALVKLIGDAFGKSLAIVSEKTEGILQIIGNLPGKIGDKLRGATNEFTKWVNQIDGILRGLHKIFDGIPDGLGKAIEKIISIFKSKSTIDQILDATGVFGEAIKTGVSKGGASAGTGFAKGFLGKLGLISSGIATFFGSTGPGSGLAESILGGAAAGAQIGTAILPGIGTAIGAAVGAIGGALRKIFGGGKSEAQKEAERIAQEQARLQLEGARQGVMQAIEQTKQAMLETASRAAKLFDELLFFTKVPRKIIKQFISELGFLFTQMAEGLKALSPEALAKIKEASEALQPAADLLAALPLVFEGISKHISVSEARIKMFFADFGKVIEFLGILADDTAKQVAKQIKKFSLRLQPAAELLAATVGFLKDMFDIKPIPIGNFDVIEDALIEITNRVGALAERMDKQFVKVLSWFAERAAAGVAFWREGIAVVKEMVDIPRPTEADFKSLFSSLETGLNESIALAARLAGEAFDNSVLFWERATVLFETVRAGMDIVNAISEIQQVGKEKWSVWTDNIQTMIDALNQSVNLAEMGVDLSWRFWDATRAMRENIDMGLENLKTVILAANQALSFLSQIGAQAGLAGAGNINLPPGFSGFGPSSNVTSTTNTGNTYIFNGITLTREQARGMTVEELADGIRTGARVGGGLR